LSPRSKPSAAPGKGSTRRSAPSASAHRPKLQRSTRRLVSLFVVFSLAFLAMGARLVTLQIADAPAYARLAVAQREREVTFPARRGAILDRNGNPLAISVDLHTVFVDPAHVEDIEVAARKLAPVLLQTVGSLRDKLDGAVPGDRFEYLARQVPPKVAKRVKKLHIPGIYLQVEPKRFYPGGRLASHILGFAGIDGAGLEGIEKQYDSILLGQPGRMILEQDPAGRALPQAEYSYERPVPGDSLLLTLDKQLQYFTELTLAAAARRYHAESASAIVMRPRTGEILALANVPDYDPNEASRFDTLERRNRAVTDVYEPGSAYKIVTVSAAVEEKVVKPKTTFTVADSFAYSDRVFHDSHPHPTERMTVAEIIGDSSNVGTIQIGLHLGGRKLDRYVRKFGFGSATGLDFPGESPGIVLDRDDWSGPTIATIPIGQGIAVTPLQMIQAYATLANRGVAVEPKLLYGTLGPQGRINPSPLPTQRRVVSRSTARKMSKMLQGVVEKGTGIEAQIPGYDVAGKTGTAQKPLPGGYGNAWVGSFAGFVPASRPEIVVLVTLDDPSPIWGGSTAAPTFRTITEFALRHLGVSPTSNAEKAVKEIQQEVAADPTAHD
jgi:cell division protein FtsI (penicillin-binding protein 3)